MKTRLRYSVLGLLAASILALTAGCKGGESGTADPSKNDGSGSGAASAPLPPGERGSRSGIPAGEASPGAQPGLPGATSPGAGAQPGIPLTPSGPPAQVVAKVNGESITRGELDFMIKNVVNGAESAPPEKHAEIRRNALDDLINRALVYQKAKASNVTVSPAEMTQSLAKIKANFPDEKTFVTEMAKQGMNLVSVESMV